MLITSRTIGNTNSSADMLRIRLKESKMNKWMRMIVLAALATVYATLPGCDRTEQEDAAQTDGTVTIVIYDNQSPDPIVMSTVPIAPDDTVLIAMQSLMEQDGIGLRYSGSGNEALIESLAEHENSGADGANWMFAVNGELSRVGVGQYALQPNSTVTWCYIEYDDREQCAQKAVQVR